VCLHPENFIGDDAFNTYYNDPTRFYTTVPTSTPIIADINATVLDSLYIPGEDEPILDFTCHLLTGNLDESYLQSLQSVDSNAFNIIDTMYANGFTLDNDIDFNNARMINRMAKSTGLFSSIVNWITNLFTSTNWFSTWAYKRPVGNISFKDNNLSGSNLEGVMNVKMTMIHYAYTGFGSGFFPVTTDGSGNYSFYSGIPPGLGLWFVTFDNSKVKVKNLNTSSVGLINTIGSVLTSALPAQTAPRFYFWNDLPTLSRDFDENSYEAQWSMINNGIQQGNILSKASNIAIRSSSATDPKLTVIASYSNSGSWFGLGGTPMIGHTNSAFMTGGLSWISSWTGLSVPSAPSIIDAPDMFIAQRKNFPYPSHELRRTIYHEYGHSLHYFKVGDAFWGDNIHKTVYDSPYGTNVTENPGNFFALTEGWADYIGELYAFIKYGTNLTFTETAGLDVATGDYQDHLEKVRWYQSDFIPRGIFYDFTDGGTYEPFDQISGFKPGDIYNLFGSSQKTIQQFKSSWMSAHPNTNNVTLFAKYNL
jgi:hypothetical protein